MNVFQQIAARTEILSKSLSNAKADVRNFQEQINILAVFQAQKETGLSFGDRFRIRGRHFGQVNPEAIVTGHKNGRLTSQIIGKDGKLTKNDFVLFSYRQADVVPLGPDPLGTPFLNPNFDPSALLNGEEETDDL